MSDVHCRPRDLPSVRVLAGAVGPALPPGDLRLPPDHAISADGMLIPIRALINDATVIDDPDDGVCVSDPIASHPAVTAFRFRLMDRAGALGFVRSEDADLSVYVDGHMVPAEVNGALWRVRLPEATSAVTLTSRFGRPAYLSPGARDRRKLGVAVSAVTLDGHAIALEDGRFGAGWHRPEASWRWTDGAAHLDVRDARVVSFVLVSQAACWVAAAAA